MSKKSAGILLFRFNNNNSPEVFLVHPGGPFWSKKDIGAWSIPKGEFDNEAPIEAAKREFEEETGVTVDGKFIELSPLKQKSGKIIYAWALPGDIDATKIESNLFELEWPYKSGNKKWFPEIDKAEWFSITEAKEKINSGQAAFISQLEKLIC
ncbi:MAG: NUDIX domain-containing protein [Bacteroidia bacterium]